MVDAAARGRWLVVDELDRARLDPALGGLSSFLAGVPVTLPDGEDAPPDGWRDRRDGRPGRASTARRRSCAASRTSTSRRPTTPSCTARSTAAAGGDAVAAAAVKRLLGARELGPGRRGRVPRRRALRRRAQRRGAGRRGTLAREALAAHIAPLLASLDEDGRRRLAALAG